MRSFYSDVMLWSSWAWRFFLQGFEQNFYFNMMTMLARALALILAAFQILLSTFHKPALRTVKIFILTWATNLLKMKSLLIILLNRIQILYDFIWNDERWKRRLNLINITVIDYIFLSCDTDDVHEWAQIQKENRTKFSSMRKQVTLTITS